jgi:heat shock protein HslJ
MRRLALLAALLVLAACGSDAGESGADGPDLAGQWQLTAGTVDGAALPMPPVSVATLEFADGQASGAAFCNRFFAPVEADGPALSLGDIGSTQMACAPDVMAAESAYLAALAAVGTAVRDGDDLVLTGDGVELRFSPVAPVPDSPLTGTRWVMDTLIEGEAASTTLGEPVLVLRDDGVVEGSTGCRAITGTWQLEGGTLTVVDLVAEQASCPPDVERQDAQVIGVLTAGPTAEVRGNRLTLTADDGRELGYRAG